MRRILGIAWPLIKSFWGYMSCAIWTCAAYWQMRYSPTSEEQIKVFWICAGISLTLGFVTSIVEQYTKRIAAENRIAQLTAVPDIRGEILATFWEEPKNDLGEVIPNASIFDVRLRLVNYNDVPCTIDAYQIWVEDIFGFEGKTERGTGSGVNAHGEKVVHPTLNYADDQTSIENGTQKTWLHPLRIESQWPLERARKKEGWVRFLVRNYVPSAMKHGYPVGNVAPWQQAICVTVIDSLGSQHQIEDLLALVAGAILE